MIARSLTSAIRASRPAVGERGSVQDPLCRYFPAVGLGLTARMDAYLADLQRATDGR